jgi:serine/threonine protein kinase
MKLCPQCAEPYADDAGFCPLDGTPLSRDPDPFVGRTLAARYRLLRRLGSGGMAVVYLARHVMIERLSAIKILRQDLGMNVSHRERFLREARAVNRINHPNIVEITDFGEDSGLVFLVMEYVEGESLQTALGGGPFELVRAIRIALQIASALGRAHELGVIHRDLKPENVLLVPRDGADFAKLTDFGIAKIVDAPTITFSEQRFGTPGYIAPEYINGEAATALGDLYALGVVTYQMVTGSLPFDAKAPVELLALALQGAVVRPSDRVGGIPSELEELLLRMIAREPANRPRDAHGVHDALDAVLQRLTGEVPAPASDLDLARRVEPPASYLDLARRVEPPASLRLPDLTATIVDAPPESAGGGSPRSWLAAELMARPPGDIAERWYKTLGDLERHVETAGRVKGASAGVRRARELSESARGLLASLERAKAAVAAHQAHADTLEAHARSIRATVGHAIDALSRDRSREVAHLEAISVLRNGILQELATASPADVHHRETLAWESAALEAERARAGAMAADLSYQIETLEQQLDAQNGELEAELASATGRLEGGLSAVRRITGELVRTMADAANCL